MPYVRGICTAALYCVGCLAMGNASGRDAGAHGALEQYRESVRSELQSQFGQFHDAHRPSHLHNNDALVGNSHRAAVADGDGEDDLHPLSHVDSSESMGATTPPESPNRYVSPLMFSPQVPVVPIAREDEAGYNRYFLQNQELQSQKDNQREQGILALFQWAYDGDEVYIEGSWDDWHSRTRMQKVGNEFSAVKVLPPGVYQFRFVVNGEMRYSPDLPYTSDRRGFVKNVLHLQEHIPDNVESVLKFEPPRSPEASYDSMFPMAEDFSKEPPLLPPQLHVALLDVAPQNGADGQGSLVRPQHVVLNHLYVEKGRTSQSVLGLSLTHRFRSKHVTFVLYKPLDRRT